MEEHVVKIKSTAHITHNVLRIITEKPPAFIFSPDKLLRFLSIKRAGKMN